MIMMKYLLSSILIGGGLAADACSVDIGIDYPGMDLNLDTGRNTDRQDSALACRALCNRNPKCKFFGWKSHSRECWMKTGISRKNQEPGTTSGPACRVNGTTLFATCDNLMRIYFDGVLQFEDEGWPGTDTYQWTSTTELVIPSGTKVLGIECKDLGGAKGILASTSNGLVTNDKWHCSHNQNLVGWGEPGFEDSAGDFSEAMTGLDWTGHGPVVSMPNIDNSARWIWTDQASAWAACKKRLGLIALDDGPRCEDKGYQTVNQNLCQDAARSLGYSANLQVGSWSWAPYGCFVGHPWDGWKKLYFNTQAGQTGQTKYRTLCNV